MRLMTFAAAAALLALGSAAEAQGMKPITRAQLLKTLDDRFKALDTNHDGYASKAELTAELARELQAARAQMKQQLEAQFRKLDTNHDGQLSLAEFTALVANVNANQTPDQKLQQLDLNHDGRISAEEYHTPDRATFNRIDTNHDGVITQAEIQAAMGRK